MSNISNLQTNTVTKKSTFPKFLLVLVVILVIIPILALLAIAVDTIPNLNKEAVVLANQGIFEDFETGDVLCLDTNFKSDKLQKGVFVVIEKNKGKTYELQLTQIKALPGEEITNNEREIKISSNTYQVLTNTEEVLNSNNLVRKDQIYGVLESTEKDIQSCVGQIRSRI